MYTKNKKTLNITNLQIKNKILNLKTNKKLNFNKIISFLNKNNKQNKIYYSISTNNLQTITLTNNHLIYTSTTNSSSIKSYITNYTQTIQINQFILINNNNNKIKTSQITHITSQTITNIYTPLTNNKTIIINKIITSYYNIINNKHITHLSYNPLQ